MLLVATGYPSSTSRKTETISFSNKSCNTIMQDYPVKQYQATAGLLKQTLLICGGEYGGRSDACYYYRPGVVNKWIKLDNRLSEKRIQSGSYIGSLELQLQSHEKLPKDPRETSE